MKLGRPAGITIPLPTGVVASPALRVPLFVKAAGEDAHHGGQADVTHPEFLSGGLQIFYKENVDKWDWISKVSNSQLLTFNN